MRFFNFYFILFFVFCLFMIDPCSSLGPKKVHHNSSLKRFEDKLRHKLISARGRKLLDKLKRMKRVPSYLTPSIFGFKISTLRKLNRMYHMYGAFRDTMDEFPWRIQKRLDKMMASMYFNFVKNETDNVNLPCENDVISSIKSTYSKAVFRWRHNSKPVELDPSRMVLYKGTLVIRNLQLYDTGVYTCQIEYQPGKRKTVGIYSVLVKTDEINLWVKETLDMTLTCNSQYLGEFYPNASREWFYNNVLFDKFNVTNASLASSDVFKKARRTFNGTWVCRVVNENPRRVWYPAVYNVMILPPPRFYELVVMYVMSNKAKSFFLFLGFIFSSFIIIVILAYFGREYQDTRAKRKQIMKEKLLAVLGGSRKGKQKQAPKESPVSEASSDSGLGESSEPAPVTSGSEQSSTEKV